jgi:hypothetical protein
VAKKIIIAVVVLGIALAAYFGGKLFASIRNTPERAGNTFMTQLIDGDATATYDTFTSHYKQEYSKSGWKSYVDSYVKYKTGEDFSFVKREDLTDRFNTYPEGSAPQRLIYETSVANKKYQVKMIVLKVDKLWKVDDFQGNDAE